MTAESSFAHRDQARDEEPAPGADLRTTANGSDTNADTTKDELAALALDSTNSSASLFDLVSRAGRLLLRQVRIKLDGVELVTRCRSSCKKSSCVHVEIASG